MDNLTIYIDDDFPTNEQSQELLELLERFHHTDKLTKKVLRHYSLDYAERKLKERGYDWAHV